MTSMTLTPEQIAEALREMSRNEAVQRMLVQHFLPDVVMEEARRRLAGPVLLTIEDVARKLHTTVEGIRSAMQERTFGVAHIRSGKGGRYLFDPRDLETWIQKRKVHPIEKPESLRSRARQTARRR